MASLKSINGLLLVNKPSGMTSHDVVSRVRRVLGIKEVGHAGTLDPMAEGLMVLLLGEATKLSAYVLEQDKTYELTMRLGQESDTLDSTGKITKESPVTCQPAEVLKAAKALEGEWLWDIPLYSAKKIDGQKLYEKARQGEAPVVLPQKWMKFWAIENLERPSLVSREAPESVTPIRTEYSFRLSCSKGSFVRSWVQALGGALGCGALMTGLRRTQSTPYSLSQAIPLEELANGAHVRDQFNGSSLQSSPPCFVPLRFVLPTVKTVKVGGYSEGLIRNGQISHELRRILISTFDPEADQSVKIMSQRPEELLALVGLEKDKGFVVRRVFRY